MKRVLFFSLLALFLFQCESSQQETSPSFSKSAESAPTAESTPNVQPNKPCVGNRDCIVEVRKLVRGAGWEIANEQYDGKGIFYIDAFQYGTDNIIHVSYQMDCNCKPIDIKINPASGGSVGRSTASFHRCGDKWDGSTLFEGGIYGDYCSEKCYAMNYPN